jgi:chromosome segregation ATPase
MKKSDINTGMELLYLLRQQRYLYHQLRNLTERQRELSGTNSPELLLEVITGRRKLVEKLRELEQKLQLIKANWPKLSNQINSECKTQASDITAQIQTIISQITSSTPLEMIQDLPLSQDWKFDELLAGT